LSYGRMLIRQYNISPHITDAIYIIILSRAKINCIYVVFFNLKASAAFNCFPAYKIIQRRFN